MSFAHIISDLIRDFRYYTDFLLDLRYGGWFGGVIKTRHAHLGAKDTQSSFYYVMSPVFLYYPLRDSDVFVDVGCGKGRTINWLLVHGYRNRMIGIEIDEEIAGRTKKKFAKYKNVEIIGGNALDNIPADGTVFYLYNSVNAEMMIRFKDLLRDMFGNRRKVTIIYVNYAHLDVFVDDPAWRVRRTYYHSIPTVSPEWPLIDIGIVPSYPVAFIELNPPMGSDLTFDF